jgi:ankyrin repeat protein
MKGIIMGSNRWRLRRCRLFLLLTLALQRPCVLADGLPSAAASNNAANAANAANIANTSNLANLSAARVDRASSLRQQLSAHLFAAARTGDDRMLAEFTQSHFDLNVRDEKGYTALILAAYHGHLSSVELLLKNKADPCAKDNRGNTALMGALFKGEGQIARMLVLASCDPDQRNNAGQTAAMYAALFGRVDILHELNQRGADLNAQDVAGNSPASLAASQQQRR